MSKKITKQEFNTVKELCEVKGFDFPARLIELKDFPYLYKHKEVDVFFCLTSVKSISISFNEAIKFLTEIKE